jgi:hypothetical protein
MTVSASSLYGYEHERQVTVITENSLLLQNSRLVVTKAAEKGVGPPSGRDCRKLFPLSIACIYSELLNLFMIVGLWKRQTEMGSFLKKILRTPRGWSFPCTKKEGSAVVFFLSLGFNNAHRKIT